MAFQFDENAPVLEIKDLNLSYWTRAGRSRRSSTSRSP